MANNRKQVSLAGAAGNAPKKKKRIPWGLIKFFLKATVAVIAVVAVVIVCFNLFHTESGPSLTAEELVTYTVTPDSMSKKVSYFALGVTGEKSTDSMDMVAVMCFDHKAETISVIQLPVTTYLGKNNGFSASVVGDVWKKPTPISFCSDCHNNVAEEDIADNKHTALAVDGLPCGGEIVKQTGSSSSDLARVFNEQYGLPIDNYVVIPREGLAMLIDGMGGVDINLSKKTTLDGKTYDAGVQTLTGQAAVTYAITYNYKNTPESDRERMLRQREVLAALIQRFASAELEDLYAMDKNTEATSGVFASLMLSDVPVRFNTSSFGKAQLLNESIGKVENMKLSEAISRFALKVGKVPLENISFSILPGQKIVDGTAKYYSVNQAQTVELLNQQMNPYGLVLDDTTVLVPQLATRTDKVDWETQTLAELAQPQTGNLNEEE